MVHCGYEPSAVNDTFSSIRGFMDTVRATLFSEYKDPGALELLNEQTRPVHSYNSLVQIKSEATQMEETNA
jgi:hypothetical protein